MKLVAKFGAIFDGINRWLVVLAGVLLTFTMFAVCTEVVARYFLGHPQDWVLEVTEYILLYITFLGAAWLLKLGGHVRMDALLGQLKPRTQAPVNAITSILGFIACLVLTRYSVEATWHYFQTGYCMITVLEVPAFLIVGIIPIGSLLLAIQFLRNTRNYLRSWKELPDKE